MMNKKKISKWAGVFLGLVFLAGCQPAENGSAAAGDGAVQQTKREEPEPEGEGITITITGNDSMRFDVEEFKVKARQPVTLVFKNVGTMPKESMGHNVVILDQGVDKTAFANAGATKPRNDYIDPARENEVIAKTEIIGPGEEVTVNFVAPAKTGNYDYICSFPGHMMAGMEGVMKVE